MPAPRPVVVAPLLLACMVVALSACGRAAGESASIAQTPAIPVDAVYPPDVYRPADYSVGDVVESDAVLTIRGNASASVPVLFAQARAAMPMQGWQETQARQSASSRMLAFDKSGYRAELRFQPAGNGTRIELQLHRP